jgi:hypothetical protein
MRALVHDPLMWGIWYGTTGFVVACRYVYHRSQEKLNDAKDWKNEENESWRAREAEYEPMLLNAGPVIEGEIINIRTDKPEWMK